MELAPATVTGLAGTLRIQQGVPCGDDVDLTTPLAQGGLDITPPEGLPVPGGRSFTLGRGQLVFAGFSVHRDCLGFGETRTYDRVSVQILRAVSFTAAPAAGGIFAITIPKEAFVVLEQANVNGEPELHYLVASQDVTGTIDLTTATVQVHAVFASTTHFQAGCTPLGCLIDEEKPGTFTADLSGKIALPDADGDGVPDASDNCRLAANPDQSEVATPAIAAPPPMTLASCGDRAIGVATGRDVCDGGAVTIASDAPLVFQPGPTVVTWTATDVKGRIATATQTVTVVDATAPSVTCVPDGGSNNSFLVTAGGDACGGSTITLGSFVLANGERVKIEETGRPGVRLVNDGGSVRHFLTGQGEAVIRATDGSGNVATTVCR